MEANPEIKKELEFCDKCGRKNYIYPLSEKENIKYCLRDGCYYADALRKGKSPLFKEKHTEDIREFHETWRENRDWNEQFPRPWLLKLIEYPRFAEAAVWNLNENTKPIFKTIGKAEDFMSFPGFLLGGSVGCGKSFLLFALQRYVLENKICSPDKILYFSETDFFSELKAGLGNFENTKAARLLEKAKECDVLFYDDLGSASKTWAGEWGKQIIFEILDAHYSKMTPMYITTNFTKELLDDKVGERIGDRLNTLSCVYLNAKSLRKQPK